MRRLVVLVLGIAACSSQPSAATTPSEASTVVPSAAALASPTISSTTGNAVPGVYAVVVQDFEQGGSTYTVSLVDTNGNVAAKATPRKRTTFAQMSNLSTSQTTVYYLDGDGDIRYLRPDGSTGLATSFTIAAHQVIAFAVSPDDGRIAVSILDYTRYPVSTRLFVEDLAGHGNHIELFSSPTVLEWPAGWHDGHLVMALGIEAPAQNAYEGFMRGHGYHVADATTGNRLLSLCDGQDSYVPETSAGTVCVLFPKASIAAWDGSSSPLTMTGSCTFWGPLSPSGVMASRTSMDSGGQCVTGSAVYLYTSSGMVVGTMPVALVQNATPMGWMDGNHLVVALDSGAHPLFVIDTRVGRFDIRPVQAFGFFGAALPGGF